MPAAGERGRSLAAATRGHQIRLQWAANIDHFEIARWWCCKGRPSELYLTETAIMIVLGPLLVLLSIGFFCWLLFTLAESMNIEPSSRRTELFDASYAYVLEHGLTGLSLRSLAAAIGSSPRVLLYWFGSKENLLRELLARARREHIARMTSALKAGGRIDEFEEFAARLWTWLSAPEQRAMVLLTHEAFVLSLSREPGPWAGFAGESAHDWLDLLMEAQPYVPRAAAEARATRVLAMIRGLLIDLMACGDSERVAAAARSAWL
jgi:AcrR family transcriptional regulator